MRIQSFPCIGWPQKCDNKPWGIQVTSRGYLFHNKIWTDSLIKDLSISLLWYNFGPHWNVDFFFLPSDRRDSAECEHSTYDTIESGWLRAKLLMSWCGFKMLVINTNELVNFLNNFDTWQYLTFAPRYFCSIISWLKILKYLSL